MKGKISLGDLVKDGISGYKGIAVAYDEWMTGCKRFGIESPSKEAKEPVIRWIDEERCVLLKVGAFRKERVSTPAGPQPIDRGMPSK